MTSPGARDEEETMVSTIIPHHVFVSNSSLFSMFKLPLSFPPLLDVEYRDKSPRHAVSGLI